MKNIITVAIATSLALLFGTVPGALANSGAYLLVPSGSTNNVLRYDHQGNFVDAFIPFINTQPLRNPRAVVLGPDGNIYVSSSAGATSVNGRTGVLRYDGMTGQFIDIFAQNSDLDPFGLVFGPDGHLYVAGLNSNNIVRFNGATGAFIDVFASSALAPCPDRLVFPRGLVFGPDGHLYVSNPGCFNVLRFHGKTGAPMGVFAAGVDARGLTFGSDGNLYVASFNDDRVLRFKGTTGEFLDTFVFSNGELDGPVGLAFGSDGRLYAGGFNNHVVLRYDGTTGAFTDAFVPPGTGGLNSPRLFTFIIPVAIDIKPGTEPNEINAKAKGAIPVAILSSATFDATTVDASSLRFAGAGVSRTRKKLLCHQDDVGGGPDGSPDGLIDLVCQFKISELKIAPGTDSGVLTGLAKGVPIRGEDHIVALVF
jgi:sugar lactone lactonase YvrE